MAAGQLCAAHGVNYNGLACHRCDQDRERLALMARMPKRTNPGRAPVMQHDVDGLALFDSHRSPSLF